MLWHAQSGEQVHCLRGHTSGVVSLAFSPNGRRLASASYFDQTVKLWDFPSGQDVLTLPAGHALSVAFTADGQRLVAGSGDEYLKVWAADDPQPRPESE
jgi:WD40 repeat protein